MIQLIESENECRLIINRKDIEIIDAEYYVSAICDMDDLEDVSPGSFPEKLTLEVHSKDNFGTQLFEEVIVSVDKGVIVLDFGFHIYNKYWEGLYGLSTFMEAIHRQVMNLDNFKVINLETEDTWKSMTLRCQMPNEDSISKAILKTAHQLKFLEEVAEFNISRAVLKSFEDKTK